MCKHAVILLLLCCSLRGATVVSSSADRADVATAIASASDGDTVSIPSGTANWTSLLTVSKRLHIIGAGTNSTVLWNDGTSEMLSLIPSNTNGVVRVSGITFSNSISASENALTLKNHRMFVVDNCHFVRCNAGVFVWEYSYGVLFNSTFFACDHPVRWNGDGNTAQARAFEPGTTNTFVMEDCRVLLSSGMDNEPGSQAYHEDGARSCIRFCNFDLSPASDYSNLQSLDMHGNQEFLPASYRGTVGVEYYGNSVTFPNTTRMTYLRGGCIIAYSNTFSWPGSSTKPLFTLTEEEGWNTSFFSPVATTWPAGDQITNSFFWANTLNGSAAVDVRTNNTADATFIQRNRDYWLQSPNSTNGSPAGVYSSYQPLAYPHPLRDSISPDTTPPNISSVSASPSTTSATVTWTTDEAATGGLQWGLTTSYTGSATNSATVTSHSLSATSLSASTTYHYRVISSDASGNTTVGSDGTFTTDAETPPPSGSTLNVGTANVGTINKVQ